MKPLQVPFSQKKYLKIALTKINSNSKVELIDVHTQVKIQGTGVTMFLILGLMLHALMNNKLFQNCIQGTFLTHYLPLSLSLFCVHLWWNLTKVQTDVIVSKVCYNGSSILKRLNFEKKKRNQFRQQSAKNQKKLNLIETFESRKSIFKEK